jgi:outer membrane protein assembly factor BamB
MWPVTKTLTISLLLCLASQAADGSDELWAAAKKGDVDAVKKLLAGGANVNAKTPYGATALSFAAEKGHVEVVRLLLAHKADVDVRDTFYKASPLNWAVSNNHPPIVALLLDAGAKGAADVLPGAVAAGRVEVVRALVAKGKLTPEVLTKALTAAPAQEREIADLLIKAGGKPSAKAEPKPEIEIPPAILATYAGTYRSTDGPEIAIRLADGKLSGVLEGRPSFSITPIDKTTFQRADDDAVKISFFAKDGKVSGFVWKSDKVELRFARVEVKSAGPKLMPAEEKPIRVELPLNWPSFRGPNASGVADGQHPPTTWDVDKRINVRWKTPIPGLGHSCPVVWGDRVLLTSAVSGDPKAGLRPGLYGDVDSVEDQSEHTWRVFCLEKRTGKIVWETVAHKGVPKVKRHLKGTHANPTPVTNGKCVVVSFGAEGLYCYDLDGKLLWKRDLGRLDAGWFYDADYQWGFGSSPVIYRDLAIVQCDVGKDSFLAAYRLADGQEAWRVPREEIPSWGTPTIVEAAGRAELVTNATKFARGYDPLTGKELWRLSRNAEITVPTPVAGSGLIFVTSGYRPVQPIYAIRPGAAGDISLKEGQTSNESIAWSTAKHGPYLPTPIVYGDHLYTCSNNGIVTCYEAKSGKQVYRERLGGTGGYTASPVAADGRLYFASEEGGVRVVAAGKNFELLAVNPLGDVCMATPAISDGMIFVRTQRYLVGIGR